MPGLSLSLQAYPSPLLHPLFCSKSSEWLGASVFLFSKFYPELSAWLRRRRGAAGGGGPRPQPSAAAHGGRQHGAAALAGRGSVGISVLQAHIHLPGRRVHKWLAHTSAVEALCLANRCLNELSHMCLGMALRLAGGGDAG